MSDSNTILAVAPEAEEEAEEADPVPVALCHWKPPTVSHVETTVVLPPRLLSNIKGFTPLGTFGVPDDLDVAVALSELLAALPDDSGLVAGPEPTPQLLASLMARLGVPDQGSSLRFFFFPLYSDDPNQVLGNGLSPAWKWVKPDSIYRKAGFWEAGLHEALDSGDWNAGRNLILLTRGVSEETLKDIADKDQKSTRLEAFRKG
ncbi:hypothetical protein B0I37DRAFT_417006 [Chaetomium sp. MPI-CAGE-AT-0009]|nr:hypothetical protein B0I37DRAFT_417006 [Chaetomium sp. MPI-CAGE-AT-0009]